VAVNVAAVNPSSAGYASVFACNDRRPNTSNLNFTTGRTTSNSTLIGLDTTGGLCIFTSAEADYLLDVVGWLGVDVTVN
jgi:extracellular elastinolytic metalloproteinase